MKQLRRAWIVCGFILLGYLGNAQPGGPAAPAPLGFVEILIGVGALYGGNKMYQKQKNRSRTH